MTSTDLIAELERASEGSREMDEPKLAQYKCRACGGAGYVSGGIADEEWIIAHLKNRPGRYLYQTEDGRWLATYPESSRAVFDSKTIKMMRVKNILKLVHPSGEGGALGLTSHPNTTTATKKASTR